MKRAEETLELKSTSYEIVFVGFCENLSRLKDLSNVIRSSRAHETWLEFKLSSILERFKLSSILTVLFISWGKNTQLFINWRSVDKPRSR